MLNEIAHQRLHNQHITHHPTPSLVDVIAWLGGLQGQDYAGAKWAIGLRIPGATDAQIEQSIADRHILRTWLMRGTLHLVSAADARWMTMLLAPRLIASNQRRYGQLELDDTTLETSHDVIARFMVDQREPVLRPDLLAHVESQGISTDGQRGVYLLQYASLKGVIAQTTMRGKDMLFVPMPQSDKSPDNPAAELARTYFQARSPATTKDFIDWSGLPAADARAAIDAIKLELQADNIDGKPYWRTGSTAKPDKTVSAHLLPAFDEYLLGYLDRDAVLDPAHAKKVLPGGGMFAPVFAIDGHVCGTWKRTIKKDAVTLALEPFRTLTDEDHALLSVAADRYAQFLGVSRAVML